MSEMYIAAMFANLSNKSYLGYVSHEREPGAKRQFAVFHDSPFG